MNNVAAVYARISGIDDERERSLESQRKSCIKFALERGFSVPPDAVIMEQYSGAVLYDRPLLSQLRADIKARKYGALICHDTDRLSRDPIHLAILAEECERAGCDLQFVMAPLDHSDEANLIRYVKGYAGKIEREKIKERTMRGREEVLCAGQMVCNGFARYGYQYDKQGEEGSRGRLIDEEAAGWVRQIFEWCVVENLGLRQIARELNRRGVPSPGMARGHAYKDGRQSLWHKNTILEILRDEAYIGRTFSWKKRNDPKRRGSTGRPLQLEQPKESWRDLGEGRTPPIVERALFQRAQVLLGDRLRPRSSAKDEMDEVLLRGHIFCAYCRTVLTPTSKVNNYGTRYYYYRCMHGVCTDDVEKHAARVKYRCHATPRAHVEASVWDWMCGLAEDPSLIRDHFARIRDAANDGTYEADLAKVRRDVAKATGLQSRLYASWKDEDDPDLAALVEADLKQLKGQLASLRSQEVDIQARIDAVDSDRAAADFTEQMMLRAGAGLRRNAKFAIRRDAVVALGIRVLADGKKYQIGYDFPACANTASSSCKSDQISTLFSLERTAS